MAAQVALRRCVHPSSPFMDVFIDLFIRFSLIYTLTRFFINVIISPNHQFSLSYIHLYSYWLWLSKFY